MGTVAGLKIATSLAEVQRDLSFFRISGRYGTGGGVVRAFDSPFKRMFGIRLLPGLGISEAS